MTAGNYIRALVAVVLAGAVLYFSYGMVERDTYRGSELNFEASRGSVTIANFDGGPVTARLVSDQTFRLGSSDNEVTLSSTRQGTGRTAIHVFEGELPGGNLELNFVRGGSVQFTLSAEDAITVRTIPRTFAGSLVIVVIAVALAVGLLYYASRETGHRIVAPLAKKLPAVGPRRTRPSGTA